ncbi:uncharacterized protein HD556DRAFT_1436995 [Suillus plorans]|uniref:Uncharacterized protein n=1 Tax=Suillus plorans TaxID=116603 RepID=A0A9P7DWS1_9AGAM|nr:uncharacterized protein HD556DRAFT_1436995 [Suillus plorans]KAG1804828.1 hypothetical protein HD556DRAFT_1436995 [Suillus plorans]
MDEIGESFDSIFTAGLNFVSRLGSSSWIWPIHPEGVSNALARMSLLKKAPTPGINNSKDFLGAAKWPRLDAKNAPTSMAFSSMQFHCLQASFVSSDQVYEPFSEESSSTYPEDKVDDGVETRDRNGPEDPVNRYPVEEDEPVDGNLPIPVSNANLGTASVEIDKGLSLAQRRTKCTGICMPQQYRQYEDILLQPPPSVPSHTAQHLESAPPAKSIDMPTTDCTLLCPAPFRTARNVFGLVRQFFSSIPPSHDLEEAVTFQDINSIPSVVPVELDSHAKPRDSFYPYPNQMSAIDFDPDDVRHTHWDKINSQLGASDNDEEGYEWEDDDAGWRKTEVNIQVPFSQTTAQPDTRLYDAAQLYHRPLVSVIREKLANAHDDEHLHYEPYQLRWSPPPSTP